MLVASVEECLLEPMIVFVSLAGIGASGALYGLMLFLNVDRLIAMQTNIGRRLFILIQLALLILIISYDHQHIFSNYFQDGRGTFSSFWRQFGEFHLRRLYVRMSVAME